jgi:cephalosporin hydroxylase
MHEDIVEHIPFLQRVCLDTEAKLIVEFGVRDGGSTKAFLKVAEILGARVISIDIEDCSNVSNSPHWEFKQMDDLFFEINEPIDVLLIDTSHTYQQTIKELRKFAPQSKIVILHDTEHCPEVKEAIIDYLKEAPGIYDFENRTNNNGLGILWRKPQ